ncbi:hypothetical protein KPY62_06500 [Psychrobacter sp. TAE2020]|uniref:hypothetical protein n=1 Tax=Psychrobacter sp. TAE2020 TaxID=2846762 RepID=UPI001C0FBA1E|nr:hypothetical protein [Psychrobacter sp. TAE2020]MBU5616746.1 hypothetical protein [Psychrobacter sp. TAE2020]
MHRNDKRFVIALILTTFIAAALYFFLGLVAQSYAKNISATDLSEISKSPFIVIDLLKGGVWLLYAVAILVLILKWWAKRVKS